MIGLALKLFGSKLGGWLAAGLMLIALGATWKIQQLRIEARDGKIASLQSELREAVRVNERNAETIRGLTVATATARQARDAAIASAAERKVEVVTRTRTIIREVDRATTETECPVAPSLRAALVGMREFGRSRPHGDGVPGREGAATGPPARLRPPS